MWWFKRFIFVLSYFSIVSKSFLWKSHWPRSMSFQHSRLHAQRDVAELALDMLDCLTCPIDTNDPKYDADKDFRRRQILNSNSYAYLRTLLAENNLPWSGEKQEMLIRLLVHKIDPTYVYYESSGKVPKLEYVSSQDIKKKTVKVVPEYKRCGSIEIMPDADDLKGIRMMPLDSNQSHIELIGSTSVEHIQLNPVRILEPRQFFNPKRLDSTIIGCRTSTPFWLRYRSGIVLFPDVDESINSSHIINMAKELSSARQAVVIIPSIFQDLDDCDSSRQSQRLFDRSVTNILYLVNMLKCKSISFVGCGAGGGLALEVACDLTDLTAFHVLNNQSFVSDDKFRFSHPIFTGFRKAMWKKTESSQDIMEVDPNVLFNITEDARLLDESVDDFIKEHIPSATKLLEDHEKEDSDHIMAYPSTKGMPHINGSHSFVGTNESIDLMNLLRRSARRCKLPVRTVLNFPTQQLLSLLPLSVAVIDPDKFDQDKIFSYIRTPVQFFYGNSSGDVPIKVAMALTSRKMEILDYSIRHYQHSNRFKTAEGKIDYDAIIKDIYQIASWIGAFSQTLEEAATDGVGKSKYEVPYVVMDSSNRKC